MNRHVRTQLAHNQSTRHDWQPFAGHRSRVTGLIQANAGDRARLCVLGAGNCNDLDLATLIHAFAEIHLVDVDGNALSQGVERQGLTGRPSLHLHGDVDVTGCIDTLEACTPQTVLDVSAFEGFVEQPARRVVPGLPAPFDVVVSDCLLSQLIATVVASMGDRHPRFLDAMQAVRLGHLRLILHLLAPGKPGLLISDLVSSDSAPTLASLEGAALSQGLLGLIERQNFFHGLNPAVLHSVLSKDPVLKEMAEGITFHPPWLWHMSGRCYAVYAVRMKRRANQMQEDFR